MQSFGDIFGQVFRAIWANKLRSFLTMFGIAWGVGSMLLLIGVGEGFSVGQRQQLAQVGSDVVMMWGGTAPAVASQHVSMRPYFLTLRDEQAIVTQAPDVRDATAILNSHGNLNEQSLYETISGGVYGVQPNYPVVRFLPMAQGRFLNANDLLNRNYVMVLGSRAAEMLFPHRPAMGGYVTVGNIRFLVVGIAQKIGHGDNNSENQLVYIPLTVMMNNFAMKDQGEVIPTDAVASIQYQPRSTAVHLAAVNEVHQIVARRHGFAPDAPNAFNEWDTIQSAETVDKIFNAMDVFLGSVGLVTLGLGAVGIVNIMLVAVAERTREIGLRKAVGATSGSILMQFFLEGLTLTGLSGLIGIAGAATFMWLVQKAVGPGINGFAPPHIVPWTAALAFGALAVCGVIAGVYPASRAAAMEPVEALRRE